MYSFNLLKLPIRFYLYTCVYRLSVQNFYAKVHGYIVTILYNNGKGRLIFYPNECFSFVDPFRNIHKVIFECYISVRINNL